MKETKDNMLRKGLTRHFVDSTALLTVSNPIYSAFETFVAGMSDQVSINARLIAVGLTYAGGMGYVWGKGRDFSRKMFNITQQSLERIQTLHDSAYSGAFNLVASPLIYLASGARDPKEIMIGSASVTLFGAVLGPLLGYAVDVSRDLAGLVECARPSYPQSLKQQMPIVKKGLAALLTAASIGAMVGIYALHSDKKENQQTSVMQTERNSF